MIKISRIQPDGNSVLIASTESQDEAIQIVNALITMEALKASKVPAALQRVVQYYKPGEFVKAMKINGYEFTQYSIVEVDSVPLDPVFVQPSSTPAVPPAVPPAVSQGANIILHGSPVVFSRSQVERITLLGS